MNKTHTYLKARARIIKIIGKELISSEIISLVELVKNSYDADATTVRIYFKDIFSKNGEIWIEDNGVGMSKDKILNVWMELATPEKKLTKGSLRLSKCFERKMLGEKGIGRFAVHNLGDEIELVTRATDDCFKSLFNYEVFMKIGWNKFTADNYLNEIPIEIEERTPEYFKNSSGTLIKISSITPWTGKKLENVILKLRSLETPSILKNEKNVINKNDESDYTRDRSFSIEIDGNLKKIKKIISNVPSLSEILGCAFYKFSGTVDKKGFFVYNYEFDKPGYPDFTRKILNKKIDLKKYDAEFFKELMEDNLEKLSPGPFDIHFHVWDLDSNSLKIAGLSGIYRNTIKPNGGVRIYRDGFRVWPYGDEGDDWLGLDLQRLNAPKERYVSRNQIIGFVNITANENPDLLDQSNREGLLKNTQYYTFHKYVKSAIRELANLRKADKSGIDSVTKKGDWENKVTLNIKQLKSKVERNRHTEIYKKDIDKIEKSYKEEMDEVLERYLGAAALGIAYTLPIHELKIRLSNIKDLIRELIDDPLLQDKYLRELVSVINDTENTVKAVSSVIARQKKKKIHLKSVAETAGQLKERELKEYDIEFEIKVLQNVQVNIIEGLTVTSVINLIDNSIYWIRVKQNEMREKREIFKGKIIVEVGMNEDNSPFIRIIDNGTGIEDPLELLIEPYYSRKTDGLGLGLYLVNEIMHKQGGRLSAYNEDGAVFELIFKKEEGDKNE